MSHLTILLTTLAILVHATMGSCACKVEAALDSLGVCLAHSSTHHMASHEADHDADSLHHVLSTTACEPAARLSSPSVPHTCDHADCHWPAPQVRKGVDLRPLSFLTPFYGMSLPMAPCSLEAWQTPLTESDTSGGRAPSVRAHLANCVLLL